MTFFDTLWEQLGESVIGGIIIFIYNIVLYSVTYAYLITEIIEWVIYIILFFFQNFLLFILGIEAFIFIMANSKATGHRNKGAIFITEVFKMNFAMFKYFASGTYYVLILISDIIKTIGTYIGLG